MTQREDRRQAQIDRGTAKRNKTEWVKHTINLRYGSDLDMKFKMSPNKSHMVRHVFNRVTEMHEEIKLLRDENQQMKENIAKFQARLQSTSISEHDIRSVQLEPGQTTLEVVE
jgi:uncharacterized cupredoxin-like copper-binding protein